jgi:hypothetical protein
MLPSSGLLLTTALWAIKVPGEVCVKGPEMWKSENETEFVFYAPVYPGTGGVVKRNPQPRILLNTWSVS